MFKMKTLPCHLHKKNTIQDAINRDHYQDSSNESTEKIEKVNYNFEECTEILKIFWYELKRKNMMKQGRYTRRTDFS